MTGIVAGHESQASVPAVGKNGISLSKEIRVGKILSGAPVLLVKDVVASANYFRDKLGFSYDKIWGDPPDFCMVARDGMW